jgi:membrane protein YqaA with SNARE-associated domain
MVLSKLFIVYGLPGLFLIGLISSIIPIPTEPIVFALLRMGENPEIVLILLITGSIIGASIGYLVGKYELRRIIPFHNKKKEEEMQMYFRKYGGVILLVSPWIPIVGDLAPMVAGIENYESKKFLIVISIAKIIKSIAIVYMSMEAIEWWRFFIK